VKAAIFSARRHDRAMLAELNAAHGHSLTFHEARLAPEMVALAAGCPAVSVFVNDQLDAAVLEALAAAGTRLVATRSTGYNQIDLRAAVRPGMRCSGAPRPRAPCGAARSPASRPWRPDGQGYLP
jgi:D-lactate dehydrogenase